MRLAEHLTALRTWCKQCLPGWCKPDVLRPGILGMQGSYQYGHTTTAMHKLSTHTPSAPVKSCQSSRELDNQGTVIFLFFGGHLDGYLVRSYFAGWRTLTPHKGNDRIAQCEYGKASTRQLHSNTHSLLYLEWPHHKTKYNSLAL